MSQVFRWLWLVVFVLFVALLCISCGGPATCTEGISEVTLDPNESSCTKHCECNNFLYMGSCVDGTCKALKRENCSSKGAKQECELLSHLIQGTCKKGFQVCQPPELKEHQKWGDCQPFKIEDKENTRDLCTDGLDNDCDGKVDLLDTDCAEFCRPGDEQPCYDGPEENKGKGICKLGTRTCGTDGTWKACQGAVKPEKEVCNGEDDDCNGKDDDVDGGCECKEPGRKEPCYTGPEETRNKGNCSSGTRVCEQNGKWSLCSGEVKPTAETCNKQDDDCDGEIDEGLSGCGSENCKPGEERTCYPASKGCIEDNDKYNCEGLCKVGTQTCSQKQEWGACKDVIVPQNEECNNKDDDCDGEVDEDLKRHCYSGSSGCVAQEGGGYNCQAPCASGIQTCLNGAWGSCKGENLPQAELCNNKDENCNGQIDENVTRACTSQCGKGTESCTSGTWSSCNAPLPVAETCNGKDDDCDGQTDEDVKRHCYTGSQGCTPQTDGSYKCQAPCASGVQTCLNGAWGSCKGETPPQTEICNNKDENCDGQIDDFSRPCFPGTTGCLVQGDGSYKCEGACQAGIQRCVGGAWGTCSGHVAPTTEVCNGKDDDCNGQIDDSLAPPLCAKQASLCKGAKPLNPQCLGGQWQACTDADYKAHYANYDATEICDGVDSNCDGKVDENIPYCVNTIAGDGTPGYRDGAAGQAQFNETRDVAVDSAGNVYVADTENHRIRKIDTAGNVSTLAGSGTAGYKDGPAAQAQFNGPRGVSVDSTGNVYIADFKNNRIRKIDSFGTVTTLAGQFNSPENMTVDSAGNVYIADMGNHRVRKIDTAGNVSTLAGSTGGYKDGAASQAQFSTPRSVAVDSAGNVYVADQDNNRIRKIDTSGNVSTLAGTGTIGYKDGPAAQAQFNKPNGITVDGSGNVYVAEQNGNRIRKIDTSGNVSTLTGGTTGYRDGPAAQAQFRGLLEIAVDKTGANIYIPDFLNYRIRKLSLK